MKPFTGDLSFQVCSLTGSKWEWDWIEPKKVLCSWLLVVSMVEGGFKGKCLLQTWTQPLCSSCFCTGSAVCFIGVDSGCTHANNKLHEEDKDVLGCRITCFIDAPAHELGGTTLLTTVHLTAAWVTFCSSVHLLVLKGRGDTLCIYCSMKCVCSCFQLRMY